ncbi:type II secretion system protein J [Phenylobacterium zucineum HLK1]|uniref:Type II secretion system protein J n=1 Tax=Phenylobacterium zucineum (strain HLK1) TaxID=450851 RepID=B4RFJ3_PHEZH|nr:type II secretion system minor pseudopilin GspJ [Phenylobacterium zucineum]ACG77074.1 type II secretion system protein J [Phenylobacterium zucineum HLK1]
MKGFTLVEMMVALLIFGLVAAAGVAIMRFSVDNQQVVRAHTHRLAELQRARAMLKADLAQAAQRPVRDAAGRPALRSFSGGEQRTGGPLLALVRRGWDNPDADPRASLQTVEYRLNGGRLERRARPALDGAELGPPQVLLSGVRDARVAFLVRGQWIEALPNGPRQPLPQAVRLDLTLEDYGELSQLFLVTGEPA